jgi:hypothetical protein
MKHEASRCIRLCAFEYDVMIVLRYPRTPFSVGLHTAFHCESFTSLLCKDGASNLVELCIAFFRCVCSLYSHDDISWSVCPYHAYAGRCNYGALQPFAQSEYIQHHFITLSCLELSFVSKYLLLERNLTTCRGSLSITDFLNVLSGCF